jgi:hypothetical protein
MEAGNLSRTIFYSDDFLYNDEASLIVSGEEYFDKEV